MSTPSRYARLFALIVLLGLCALILFSAAGTARAHAVLISSAPSHGQRSATPSQTVTLRFSEPITRFQLELVSRDGKPLALDGNRRGNDIVAKLPSSLSDGVYAVNWRVRSEDGHPVSSAIVFGVGHSLDATAYDVIGAGGDGIEEFTLVFRYMFLTSVMFSVGGTFFSTWIGQGIPRKVNAFLLAIGMLAAAGLLGLLGLEENAAPFGAVFDLSTWRSAISSSLGRSMLATGVALLFSCAALFIGRGARTNSAISLILLGPALALTGHAAGAGIAWLSFAAVSVHISAATFWVGALPGLFAALGQPGGSATLSRFSRAIVFSVAGFLAAGIYLAWLQLGAVEALWNTAYGRAFVVKISLVAAALVIGLLNRLVFTPRIRRQGAVASRSMRRAVLVEIGLIALVLVPTTLWRVTPPPRALALSVPVETRLHIHSEKAMAEISFATDRDLVFDAQVFISGPELDPLDPKEVTMSLSSRSSSVSAFSIPLERDGPGRWKARRAAVPCDCEWNVHLSLLVTDFELVELDAQTKLLEHPYKSDVP